MSSRPVIQGFVSPDGAIPHPPPSLPSLSRPVRGSALIYDDIGGRYHPEEIRARTYGPANIIHHFLHSQPRRVPHHHLGYARASVLSPTAANPAFSADELNPTEPRLLIVHHPIFIDLEPTKLTGPSEDRIVNTPTVTNPTLEATRLLINSLQGVL